MEIGTLFGLPAHPLVVHAVVVLVPLVALGALASVLRASIRARIGALVAAGAVLTLVLIPFAASSGEALEERVTESAALDQHTKLGEQLLPWVAVLALATILYVALQRRRTATAGSGPGARSGPRAASLAALALAGVIVVSAVGAITMVTLIGHSGAQSVWSGVGTAPTASTSGEATGTSGSPLPLSQRLSF